ncbi:uncharacterized protein LOC114881093 isoform X2 [Osmia bicornis bicornis]|uniref:uncharacterized protein LOC114881093 isoform X2 n=1 Tax=Osmia bicornis bicornis TaxID=1437191 RepID=UPI001EAF437E|nr:uncharacterized protein LOC114881093 isoform X2 [Osmia bicornis bicornis]
MKSIGLLHDPYKAPFYQFQQSDMFMANQYVPNVLYPRTFQPANNIQPPLHTQPNYAPLLQNLLEQIRGQVSNTAPIFILPGGCQQSTNHHQQAGMPNQGGGPQATGQPTSFNYPSSVHCPPSFYPYPIPLPVYPPFVGQTHNEESSRGCGCCHRRQESSDLKSYSLNCCCNLAKQEDHRCTATNDDTVCSKRNCPASVSLQALASQFLSLPGIVSCAATRLILRKVPGSNITSTMEDTMDKAQKAICMLTKEQLLTESRNAQQVNALINLHMTTNPPANIIPLLTLIQLKVNVLKAQIESLINKKVMECQGFGYEVETSGPIDPTVLSMKTNEELRHLLSALRQKECDERVNVNFSPYHSQRVIAEARLSNVQAKIRQVEAEFDRRRSVSLPLPSLTSRVIQQFAESTCTFGFAQTKLFEPYPQENPLQSPDPFSASIRNPKRLYLKPRAAESEATRQRDQSKATSTSQDAPPSCKDTGTGEGNADCSKERSVGPRSSEDSCSCHFTSSDESIDQGKKKLRLRIDRAGKVTISSAGKLEDASLANFSPNVVVSTDQYRCTFNGRCVSTKEDDIADRESEIREILQVEDPKTDADTLEVFDLPRVKKEPEDATDVETSENVDVPIKIKEPEDKPHYKPTMLIGLKSKKTEMETQPSTAAFVTEKRIQIKEQPKILKKIKIKDVQVEGKTETQDVKTEHVDLKPEMKREVHVDSKSKKVKTELYINLERPSPETKDIKAHEKLTAEVPEEKVTTTPPSEQTIKEKPSSDVPKSFFGITLRKAGESKKKPKTAAHEDEHTKDKIKSEDDEASAADMKEKLIVEDVSKQQATGSAMLADEQLTDKESSEVKKNYFGITLKKRGEPKRRPKTENDKSHPKNGEHENVQIISMVTHMEYDRGFGDFDGWVDTKDYIDRKIKDEERTKDNCLMSIKHERMFPKNHQPSDEKHLNGIARFPPLKNAAQTVTNIPENIFHQEEIESGSSRAVYNRRATYHPDSGNSIVSTIYSVIENQLTSFTSLFANIPNLQNIVSSLCYDKLPSERNVSTLNPETIVNRKESNKEISGEDDWTLLPGDDDGTSGESCISINEGFSNIHKIKQSIIVDKENKNYVLIRSFSGQLNELSRNGLQRPYHTRRTLVIRSRLKNPGRLKDQRPFTILKRSKKNKVLNHQETKQVKHQSKTSKDICFRNDTKINKNCSFPSVDRSLSKNKKIFSDSGVNKQV